jgi:tripartite-type tricarboxylate transporter receptor subunit TctC
MHAPRIQRRKATLATGVLAALSAIGSVAAPAIAHAQAATWPQRPVRVIVPNGPGASSDNLARVLALKLGETVGQQFVVDNRPGAGGLIGMEIAARAVPDGYTLLATSTANHVIAPQLHRKLNFDVFKDFQPVSLYGVTQNVLVVHPSMPATTAQELIALLKATPGKYNMASAGSGSQSHLAGVQLMLAARTESTHVPYKGGGASVGAVVANESQFTFTPIAATIPFIRSGQLRALATAGTARSTQLPDMPTLNEGALPGFQSTGWVGVMTPRGTPKAVNDRLLTLIHQVMKQADTRELIVRAGADPVTSSPEEFGKFIQSEFESFRAAVRAAKLAVE